MKNKEQILVVPVNYVSSIKNGFSGATSFSTVKTYSLYDSIGVYKPRYEIDNNICFIKIDNKQYNVLYMLLIIDNIYNRIIYI